MSDNWFSSIYAENYLTNTFENHETLFVYPIYVGEFDNMLEGVELCFTTNEQGHEMKYQQEMYDIHGKTISVTCCSLTSEFSLLQNTFDQCVESIRVTSIQTPTESPLNTPLNSNSSFPIEYVYALTAIVITVIISVTLIVLKRMSVHRIS